MNGIGHRRLQRLIADGQHGDEESRRCGDEKDQGVDGNVKSEGGQPFVHENVSRRPGDQIGGQHPQKRFPAEKHKHRWVGGAENFSDSDFFGSLFDGKGGHAKHSQTGDEESEQGGQVDQAADPPLAAV